MLASRPIRPPPAGPASQPRNDAAPGGTAATPFARLERQLMRGAPRLGPERALADRVFSVVARSICSTVDVTLDDSGQDDLTPVASPLPAPEPPASGEPPVGTPQPSTDTAVVQAPPRNREAHPIGRAQTPLGVDAIASMQRATPPSRRVSGVGAPARPVHHQTLSRHRGFSRALMLSLALAVLLVALTLNLLATPGTGSTREASRGNQGHQRAHKQPEAPARDDKRPPHR